jgi:hypothetical protein
LVYPAAYFSQPKEGIAEIINDDLTSNQGQPFTKNGWTLTSFPEITGKKVNIIENFPPWRKNSMMNLKELVFLSIVFMILVFPVTAQWNFGDKPLLECPSMVSINQKTVKIKAIFDPANKPKYYRWRVTGGEIVGEIKTPVINVKLSETKILEVELESATCASCFDQRRESCKIYVSSASENPLVGKYDLFPDQDGFLKKDYFELTGNLGRLDQEQKKNVAIIYFREPDLPGRSARRAAVMKYYFSWGFPKNVNERFIDGGARRNSGGLFQIYTGLSQEALEIIAPDNNSEKPTSLLNGIYSPFKYDEFNFPSQSFWSGYPAGTYGIYFNDHKLRSARLEDYAVALKQYPDSRAQFVYHSKKGEKKAGLLDFVQKDIDFLVTEKKIKKSRILIKDGGVAQTSKLELWLLPKSK